MANQAREAAEVVLMQADVKARRTIKVIATMQGKTMVEVVSEGAEMLRKHYGLDAAAISANRGRKAA